MSAVLEVQLGTPASPRPGAPEAHQEAAGSLHHQQPGQRRRRRHRGPGSQARDAARLEAWGKHRLESQKPRQSPPPPAMPADEIPAVNTAQSLVQTPEKEPEPEYSVTKPFKCDQCNFSSHTKRGLNVHNGKAHRPEPAPNGRQEPGQLCLLSFPVP